MPHSLDLTLDTPMRKPPPDTTDIDAYRRYIRKALKAGEPLDVDVPTRKRTIRSTGWKVAQSLSPSRDRH